MVGIGIIPTTVGKFTRIDMDLEHLAKLADYLEATSVWNVASVADEPDTKLTQWRIFSIRGGKGGDKETVHFVGYTEGWHGEGRVCSAVQTFDGATRKGVTKSGRIYELVGDPGYNSDAMYVWARWLSINGDPDVEDITDSYPGK
jgi:hypothetical protein